MSFPHGAVQLRTSLLCLIAALVLCGCSLIDQNLSESSETQAEAADVSLIPVPEPIIEVEAARSETVATAIADLHEEPSQEPSSEQPPASISQPVWVLQDGESMRAVETLCREIGNKLGSVSFSDCQRQQMSATAGTSVLNRPLALREYPPLDDREPLGRILMIGGIHGDEYSSVSIVFKWMDILNQHHSGLFHWHVIPLSNPDGLLRDSSQRQNENGVDLNRNFPSSDWNELALEYWEERTGRNDRRYPGSGPASEPEVAWLVEHIESFQPDIIVSVHAPYHLVDYDGPPEAPQRLGDLYLSKLGVYPGSLGNYAGIDLNTPVVTIELPYAGIMPNDSHIDRMWTDLVSWLRSELSDPG